MNLRFLASNLLIVAAAASMGANLTGSNNMVDATFVGNYTPTLANTPQNVTYSVGGVHHTASIILSFGGGSTTPFQNGTPCRLLLPGSTPFYGSGFGANFVTFVLGYVGGYWAHDNVPINTAGALTAGVYLGSPQGLQYMYYYYPSFTAAGIHFTNGFYGLWQIVPKSFDLPIPSLTAATSGNVSFPYITGTPASAVIKVLGAGAGQVNSYEWGGAGTMTSMTCGGICAGGTVTVCSQATFDTTVNSSAWHG